MDISPVGRPPDASSSAPHTTNVPELARALKGEIDHLREILGELEQNPERANNSKLAKEVAGSIHKLNFLSKEAKHLH